MHTKNRARFVYLLFAWAALYAEAPRSEAGAIYTYTDLDTFPRWVSSRATGINSSGDVIGDSFDPRTGAEQAFLYHNGTMTALGIHGDVNTINDSGAIVGYDSSNGKSFVYQYGVETLLPGGVPPGTAAVDINNGGQVLISNPGFPSGSEILDPDGTVKIIPNPLGGQAPGASSINDSGQVVGMMNTPAPPEPHAFLYSNGVVTDLGAKFGGGGPDHGHGTAALSINDAGQVPIVPEFNTTMNAPAIYDTKTGTITNIPRLPGTSLPSNVVMNNLGQVAGTTSGTTAHLFLYAGGVLQDLTSMLPDTAHWSHLTVTGMNDAGQIVGFGTDLYGEDYAFLLSPQATVPEPTTLACWVLAGLGLAIRRQRRRKSRQG